jgi:UrcA family protein
MKRTLIAAAAALCFAVPALAQTAVSVRVPANLDDAAAVQSFRSEVASAIRSVCREAEGPVLGFNIYGIRKCIAETSKEVAKLDTTGFLSAELLRDRSFDLAAK